MFILLNIKSYNWKESIIQSGKLRDKRKTNFNNLYDKKDQTQL